MNRGYCDVCGQLVPATPTEREGRIFLAKCCPECGTSEALIASDARRYHEKRKLDTDFEYNGCSVNCLACKHKKPNIVIVDITNRCNQRCPICINSTPKMGFLFEPPLEYFDKVFRHYATFDPPPYVQLFGGEPTVRDDLFDIIALAQSYGLPLRLITNGLKLADKEYCRRLVETGVTILLSYDGDHPRCTEH